MSVALLACPDWKALAAARDAAPGDPPGWAEALAHLDCGCAQCRRAAVAADPMLAFRLLPGPALDADAEVEAMRLRVAALRGMSAVTAPPRRSARWRVAAAAAVVALAALAGGNVPRDATGQPSLLAAGVVAPPSFAAPAAAAAALAAELAAEPLLEGIDKPFEHVVQWNGDDLSVILVVDQRLGCSDAARGALWLGGALVAALEFALRRAEVRRRAGDASSPAVHQSASRRWGSAPALHARHGGAPG